MMGIRLDTPFPLYPNGFPADVIGAFESAIARTVLGNEPASGTEIIEELGEEHMASGRPIVYTSGDSVFQIACHKDVVPLETLYRWCVIARRILDGPHRVGRVIARPFEGTPGHFVRSPERRDYSVPPPGPTVLDHLSDAGVGAFAVGKIQDMFCGRGITEGVYSSSNEDGLDLTIDLLRRPGPAMVFANLVDFDSKYGHRNDAPGYARALETFDEELGALLGALHDDDLVFITADHGCDPTDVSTDHTREYVPLLVAGPRVKLPRDLGTRRTFADLGVTICEYLGVPADGFPGKSALRELY